MGANIVYKSGDNKSLTDYVVGLMQALNLDRNHKVCKGVFYSPEDGVYSVYETTSKELDIVTEQGSAAVKAYFAKLYEVNPQMAKLLKPLEEAFVTTAMFYEGGGLSSEGRCGRPLCRAE
jgi:hypothetical protein